jgi:hypothetical protein
MWEATVLVNRTSVGLDVHARSVVACGLDGQTGELFERRLSPDHAELLGWLRALPVGCQNSAMRLICGFRPRLRSG